MLTEPAAVTLLTPAPPAEDERREDSPFARRDDSVSLRSRPTGPGRHHRVIPLGT
jgi:hypothetical protein